jgi:hypothetical protein
VVTDSTTPRDARVRWILVAAIFLATQCVLALLGTGSLLPSFLPFGDVPYNVKWWLALSTLMTREGPLVVWTPYPPVFPLAHLALFHAFGFDAEVLWRHFFLRDAAVAEEAAVAVRQAQWAWSYMNGVLLVVLAGLLGRLVAATRGRSEAWIAAGAYLLMSQSYASRVLTGLVSDQFDYLPCALLVGSLLALARQSPGGSALAAALGAATKLFPVVVAPVAWWRLRDARDRAWYAGVFALVSVALWLPLLLLGQRPLVSFLRFTGDRGAWESVWLFPTKQLPPWPSASEMTGLFDAPYATGSANAGTGAYWALGVLTVVGLGAVFVAARRRVHSPMEAVRCVLLSLLVILLFAKGFSSYFVQWFFPLLFVVYRAEHAAAWVGAFLVVGNLEFVGDPTSWPLYWPSLFLRHALLLALALHQASRLFAASRAPVAVASAVAS